MNNLTLFVNDEAVFECDRESDFETEKLAFFDKMDNDMARGVKIQGELISEPDQQTRARFVVMNLIKGIKQENHAVIQSSSAYLMSRMPDLHEVRVSEEGSKIVIEFVEDSDSE
ncbi:MAG: hypothetical protein OEY00_02305 [Gammaproteobacteria bacterium]|nr:hypothetical protein [Gammaproteobacteria bacterium]